MKRRWYPLLILLTTLVGPTTAYSPTGQRPSQYYPSFVSDLPSMKGKVVAITGASRGLGFVTALALAEKGATMFLLNRASSRSDEALALIAAAAERAGSSAPPPGPSPATCWTSPASAAPRRPSPLPRHPSTASSSMPG